MTQDCHISHLVSIPWYKSLDTGIPTAKMQQNRCIEHARLLNVQGTTRKSVPVDEPLTAFITAIRTPGTPENAAIETITGPLPMRMTEAAALSTLLSLGKDVVADAMAYNSYVADAASPSDEDREYDQWSRERRVRRDSQWA